MPLLEKEIIAPDEYQTPTGVVRATPARIRHWYEQGRKMLAKRLQIPLPWEHQEDAKPRTPAEKLADQARYNAGQLRRYFLDRDGRLWGVLDIPDARTAEHVQKNVKYVSPEIDPEFTDGDGETWHDVITHVALTPRPVYHRQSPFGTKPRLAHNRCTYLSLNQRMGVTNMAEYDDDQDYDRDDEEGGGGAPDDAALVDEIKGLLSQKMGLDLPEHTDKDTLLRDLSVALHAHPGHGARMSDEEDEEQAGRDYDRTRERGGDGEEPSTALMGHRRRPAGRLSHGRGGRITPERGRQAAAEIARNCGLE